MQRNDFRQTEGEEKEEKACQMLIRRPVKRLRWKGQPVKRLRRRRPVKGLRVTISERSFLRRLHPEKKKKKKTEKGLIVIRCVCDVLIEASLQQSL